MNSASRQDKALISRLRDLVAFDTQNPQGDEAPLAEKLAGDLRGLEARDVQIIPTGKHRSVYAAFGAAPPRLLINAHIDTVPANRGYTSDPFTLTEAPNGDLVGLGACDTKGAIAAVLDAVHGHRQAGTDLQGFALLFSGDEERKGTCIRSFLQSPLAQGLTEAIACEPTSCAIGVRHRGIGGARVTTKGPGGHSSRADDVAAPMVILARVALALDEMGKAHRDRGPEGFKGLCMNVAAINGGIAMNVIPAQGELLVSFRPGPGVDMQEIMRQCEQRGHRAAGDATVQWHDDAANPPFACADSKRFVDLLGAAAAAPTDLHFWTEAALFAEAGINAAVFGPGDIAQAHAPNEFVSQEQLIRARDAFSFALAAGIPD